MYFSRVLIANRGEIAVRLVRACRELGIEAVAVYSDEDAGALHVRLADRAWSLGPEPAAGSGHPRPYLNLAALVAAAVASGAQALHPGYGFLSENPALARACIAAGIVFVGPPPEAIELMGSKIAAKRLAQRLGVPVLPGYDGDDQHDETLLAQARRLGFPLLIKASAGGGGRGMRAVSSAAELPAALEAARREALAAFGSGDLLLERLLTRPRHIEIQVLADAHGRAIHLGERECSIQRRHQKIIEECPSPALDAELRAEMGAAAVRLALAAGYVNAGTVEFLVAEEHGGDRGGAAVLRPYFLEMNTRLQVEHPVTELVAGVDLVRLQLAIAAGEPLPCTQEQVALRGHAIEARIYAEDPSSGLPAAGMLALFDPPAAPGVRNDAGVSTGDAVGVRYDPMLAKLIAFGDTRSAALARLRAALDAYVVLGVITNLPQLRAIVAHPAFAAGNTTTDFLTANPLPPFDVEQLPLEALAAAAMYDLSTQHSARLLPLDRRFPSLSRGGNRLSKGSTQHSSWRAHALSIPLRYRWGEEVHSLVASRRQQGWELLIDTALYQAQPLSVRFDELCFRLELVGREEGGRLVRCRVARDAESGDLLLMLAGTPGALAPLRLARPAALSVDTLGRGHERADGAGLASPMPGTVVKLLVEAGQQVTAGQPLLVLEAMKMEHTIAAPHAGVVRTLPYRVGQLVPAGALLAEIDAE
jgi:3-methylcrotonyl-CoA carboxylase alpha subunit